MRVESVGILGYGHFGRFMHKMLERFASDIEVCVHSSRGTPGEGAFVTRKDALACDAVLLCVPIGAYEETLTAIKPDLPASTILIDVATVKMHTENLIKTLFPDQPFVSTHPMFGPESYAKSGGDVAGFRIVICDSNLPETALSSVLARLSGFGFDIVHKTAEEHDREMAETLFLTHYIGQVVARGGFVRTDIDTVSFGFLMDAVDSVRHDIDLFEQVYRFNPHCEAVVQRFTTSQRAIRKHLPHYSEDD